MADKKISELTNITGANLADGDELVVVDTSASETKAITFGEFKTALDTSTGFVRITGDTMTGDLDIQGTLTSDGLTVDGNVANITLNNTDTTIGQQRLSEINFDQNDPDGAGVGTVASIYALNRGSSSGFGALVFQTGTASTLADRMRIEYTGDISFYEDTGTTAKFFWDASGESLGIGTTSPIGGSLHLAKSGTSDYTNMFFQNTGASGRNYQLGVGGSNTGNYAGKFYIYDSTAGQPRFSLASRCQHYQNYLD